MKQITIKLPEHLIDMLEEHAEEEHDGNRSEAARQLLRRGTEYDEIRQERDRLERQYRQLVEQREEHTELVEWAKSERDLQQRRERRQSAPVWRRAKWWLTGAPTDG